MSALSVRRLTVRYPGRTAPALEGFSETVTAGELVLLAGPSGCGKSTLLHTVMGYVPEGVPATVEGELALNGHLPTGGVAERIGLAGLVQQDPEAGLCTLSVRDEVAFGPENLGLPRQEIASRVAQALATTDLRHLRDRSTWDLSGGEKQRLALASLLSLDPPLVLLDEPTAHLDPPGVWALLELLGRLRNEGRAVVVAEHQLGLLGRLAPRAVWLREGRPSGPTPMGGGRPLRVRPSQAGPPVASVEDLRFAHPGGREFLGGLSFSLTPGEILGVIGPNGAGKTTLLRLLAGLVRPVSGQIRVLGCDPTTLRASERAVAVGFVCQMPQHQLFADSVGGEFRLGGPARADADRWLRAAGLRGMSDRHPLRLSVGERRRLTVALGLAPRPRIVLLDEPFIGQDGRNVAWVGRALARAAAGGASVVLVSHHIPEVARLAHRILYLGPQPFVAPPAEAFGELVARGQELFTPSPWEDGCEG